MRPYPKLRGKVRLFLPPSLDLLPPPVRKATSAIALGRLSFRPPVAAVAATGTFSSLLLGEVQEDKKSSRPVSCVNQQPRKKASNKPMNWVNFKKPHLGMSPSSSSSSSPVGNRCFLRAPACPPDDSRRPPDRALARVMERVTDGRGREGQTDARPRRRFHRWLFIPSVILAASRQNQNRGITVRVSVRLRHPSCFRPTSRVRPFVRAFRPCVVAT